MKRILLLSAALFLAACNSKEEARPEAKFAPIVLEQSCETPKVTEDLSDPQNIEDVVALINALPKPLKLNCFIQSLKRPLYVNATASILSAQPAEEAENPRIFIIKGNLYLSLVPTGDGAKYLELSEYRNVARTTKAELKFPIEDQISQSAPYERFSNGERTTCSGCHRNEIEDHKIDGIKVYSSVAIKPLSERNITLEQMKHELYLCDFDQSQTDRCLFYRSLLNYGEVISQDFPDGMPTFFGTFTP